MSYSNLSSIFQGTSVNLIVIIIAFLIVSFLAIFLVSYRSKLRKVSEQLKFYNRVLGGLTTEHGVEKHLNQYLEIIMSVVELSGYYFYLLDPKSDNYVLRVNRQVNSSNKETYKPPLGLPRQNEVEGVTLIKDGEVPLVQISIKGEYGLIRMGPVRGLSGRVKADLKYIGEILQPALKILLGIEKQKNDSELVVATGKAINGIAKSIYDVDSLNSKMMMLSSKMINADACCLIINHDGVYKLPNVSGFKSEIENRLRIDHEVLKKLSNLVGTQEFNHLSPHTKDFDKIPLYIVESGFQSVFLIRVESLELKGVAFFWYHQAPVVEQHRIETVKMLLTRLEDLFKQQSKYKELTNSYLGALKILVEATDNLEPFTVGHSELIANYSAAIAKQLKLPEQDVKDIELAGYFHDIGMIGLSNDILFKPGKYSALEFETMKLHAEVGASIGESTIANSNASLYIRHHHERWDGYGYPLGLRGNEIPLGARIIAAADMFNAKLGGRKYREPASFEQAIKDLVASAGTQLDPTVVHALLNWFRKKQADPGRQGKSLGPCSVLRCCPPTICKQCVAYNRTDKNCWEFNGVNCTAHGNNCTTCFVRSEAIYRDGQKLAPFSVLVKPS